MITIAAIVAEVARDTDGARAVDDAIYTVAMATGDKAIGSPTVEALDAERQRFDQLHRAWLIVHDVRVGRRESTGHDEHR